jgi:SAM-dependent methyltransferase
LLVSIGLLLLGLAIAVAWVQATGAKQLVARLASVQPGFLLVLATITASWAFVRFLRWQFLLRQVGVRVPTRPSLGIYLISFVGTVTPAYLGELVLRSALMRYRFRVPVVTTGTVVIAERLLDIAVLAVIAVAAAQGQGWWPAALAGVLALSGLIYIRTASSSRSSWPDRQDLRRLLSIRTLLPALGLSLVAWLPAALLLVTAAASLGISVPLPRSMSIYSSATLLGGLSLMPAGVGVAGSTAILALEQAGVGVDNAVATVTLYRMMSTGLALSLSAVVLALAIGKFRLPVDEAQLSHFDAIAAEYQDQFSSHVWAHLLRRKIQLITAALPDQPADTVLGLDLGCGLGRQCLEMTRLGYRVVGVDAAHHLVHQAQRAGVMAVTADALHLPFDEASFDFVYTIGVLHHIPGRTIQAAAYQEARRILKPGGVFIVHETNPHNPLFRLYMGYIFPILKSIDEGTEWWIDPRAWQDCPGLALTRLHYFTFLPDFTPRWLMRPLLALERMLEQSRLRTYSVHYVAVLQRT